MDLPRQERYFMNQSHGFVTFLFAMLLSVLLTITALQWRTICYLEELAIQKTHYIQKKYRLTLLANYSTHLVKHRFDDIMAHFMHYQGPLKVLLKPTDLFDRASVELLITKNAVDSLIIKALVDPTQLAGKKFEYTLCAQSTVANGESQKMFSISNWGFEI